MKQLHHVGIVNMHSEIISAFLTYHQHHLIILLSTHLQDDEAHFGIISDLKFPMATLQFKLDAMTFVWEIIFVQLSLMSLMTWDVAISSDKFRWNKNDENLKFLWRKFNKKIWEIFKRNFNFWKLIFDFNSNFWIFQIIFIIIFLIVLELDSQLDFFQLKLEFN